MVDGSEVGQPRIRLQLYSQSPSIPSIYRRVSEKTYRAGVIGLGVMGSIADGMGGRHPEWFRPCCHAETYLFHAGTELVAGSTRDLGRQRLFREKYGNLPVYEDYREMLTQEDLDIVSIATPAVCHSEMVLAAVDSGVRGIYCEKAMAVSIAECDVMNAACEKAGVVLAINHQRRWDDRFRALKRLVDEGVIGKLQSIQVSFGGGRLCRGGSHMFDLSLMLCGDQIAQGCGWLSDPEAFDPGGIGLFETTENMRIVIDGSVGMRHAFQLEIAGERGVIRIVDGGFKFELWTQDERSEFGQLALRHLPMNYPVGNPMVNAVDDLVRCMEKGGCPLSSGLDGQKSFEMITAIHLSHREGRAFVKFPVQEKGLMIPSN